MEGLSTLVNLRVLDVSSNELTSVNDIQNLTRLEHLWLNDNQIESLENIAEAISTSTEKLTTIYLVNNPCHAYDLNSSIWLIGWVFFIFLVLYLVPSHSFQVIVGSGFNLDLYAM
ncbi:hypothetical protein DITRI_Ditri03aG0061900 [Diplodiscus trichospermus]